MENQKISLYKIRSFGEKIGDTFGFVSENIKPMLKFISLFILPLALVMGWVMNGYANGLALMSRQMANRGDASTDEVMTFVMSVGGFLLTAMLAYTLLYAVVYGLMRVYGERENGLKNLAWSEFKPTFFHLLGRTVKLALFWAVAGTLLVVALVAVVAFAVKQFGLVAIIPIYALLFAVLIPLSLMAPIYLFEDDTTLLTSLAKSLRLGFKTWGGVLAVTLVLSLIVGLVVGIVSLPWSIALMMKAMFAATGGGDGFSETVGFNLVLYLLSVLQAFVSFLCYSIPIIGLAYQYGHAAEKIEKTNLAS